MGFLTASSHARKMMYARIANQRLPLKSAAGKAFRAFPVHAQRTILHIRWKVHGLVPSSNKPLPDPVLPQIYVNRDLSSLSSQVDAAQGAEEMVEQLTEKTLKQEEQIQEMGEEKADLVRKQTEMETKRQPFGRQHF